MKGFSANAVPNYSLCGFKRVSLKAGESKTIEAEIREQAFESVDENGVRSIEGNEFVLYAGTHQPDELSEKLTGTKCLSVKINR